MLNSSVYSPAYEKIVYETRKFLISEGLRNAKHLIIDNVNASPKHFKEICDLVQKSNRDVCVMEKPFYIPLQEAIERDSKREGKARVGEEVIRKFWKELGGEKFAEYKPKVETFTRKAKCFNKFWEPMVQDKSKPLALICDLDGTYAIIGARSPYDASQCDLLDSPNQHVIDTVKLYYNIGYKILFCSGRQEKDREPTIRFIERYFSGEYKLFMRLSADQRKDSVIKKEIFDSEIKNKYNVRLVLDDRLSVSQQWHNMGLNILRAGDPSATF
jgi:predicted kinase